jgi:hypothetical protein
MKLVYCLVNRDEAEENLNQIEFLGSGAKIACDHTGSVKSTHVPSAHSTHSPFISPRRDKADHSQSTAFTKAKIKLANGHSGRL